MYATGRGIKPWRATLAGGFSSMRRLLAAVAAVSLFGVGLALGAHGSTSAGYTAVAVVPGDTLCVVAPGHNPAGVMRVRVAPIEKAQRPAGTRVHAGPNLPPA